MENLRNRKSHNKSQRQAKEKVPESTTKNDCNEFKNRKILVPDENESQENKTNGTILKEEKVMEYCEDYLNTLSTKEIIGRINFQLDVISISLFICGLVTRMYKLEEPRNIVYFIFI